MNKALESKRPSRMDIGPDFNEAEYEELKAENTPESRNFVPTEKLELTALNNKRVTVRVFDGQLKSGGIFSASYLLFTVQIDPIGWKIQRKD